MSIEVKLDELAEAVAKHRFAYLLTVTDQGRVHVVEANIAVSASGLEIEGPGGRTRANLAARPEVTLVWPPVDEGGYSLIVDGTAALSEAGATVAPTKAVLHRPAAGGSSPSTSGCGSDCVPVGES